VKFWKKEPAPPWQERFDRAKSLVLEHSSDAAIGLRIDDVERSLLDSLDDRARLRSAIDALAPAEAAADLKRALRERHDPTAADTPLIRTLRERHESINELRNRLESLEGQQESTLVDLDTLAAHLVEASMADIARPFEAEVDRLRADAELLRAAHAEIEHL
jgi:hypothetical protein